MKYTILPVILVVTFCCPGCVIAPIPLIESKSYPISESQCGEDQTKWGGVIVEQSDTLYLPIIASCDGPAKLRSDTVHYTYSLKDGDGRKNKVSDLDWLELKCESNNRWYRCIHLDDTPYWMTIRHIKWEETYEPENRKGRISIHYEIAVFDSHALKHKNIITTEYVVPVSDKHKNFLVQWEYDKIRQVFEYDSGTGLRWYRPLDGIDVPAESASIINKPNKALVPTPVSVTPAAGAPVAPDTGAAHL